MGDVPEFYGIRRSNMRDLDLWSREMFPSAFSVALMNYMDDKGMPLNYVVTDSSLKCSVRTIGTREIYGSRVKVYLFGSRLDDTKRGGDIDLLIRNDEEKQGVLARIRLIANLKRALGDRKIDVIGDYEDNEVAREALEKGVLLV